MSSPQNTTDPGQSQPVQPQPHTQAETGGLPPLPPLPEVGQTQPVNASNNPPNFAVSVPEGTDQQQVSYPPQVQFQPGAQQVQPGYGQPVPDMYNQQFQSLNHYQPSGQAPLQPGMPQPQYDGYGVAEGGTSYGQAGAYAPAGQFSTQMPTQVGGSNDFAQTLGRAFKAIPESFLAVTRGHAAQAFKLVADNKLYGAAVMLIGGLGFALLLPLAMARISDMMSDLMHIATWSSPGDVSGRVYVMLFFLLGRLSSSMALLDLSAGTYVGLSVLGLLFWCLTFALAALVVFGTWRICRGHGSYLSALNVVAVPFTPLAVVMLLWGLVSAIPSTELFSFATYLALFGVFVFVLGAVVLTYIGINQHERLTVSPFVAYVLLTVVTAIVIFLMYYLILAILL